MQGGLNLELRAECARELVAMDFPGYALGGFSVGEAPEEMHAALPACAALLPEDKPRYLMGVGRPEDLLAGVAAGIDMFDCVMPTRNGRNALAFTADGPIRLRNARHRRDSGPGRVRLRLLLLRELLAGVPAPPVRGGRDARADAPESAQRRVLPAVDGETPARRSRRDASRPSTPVALPGGRPIPRLRVPILPTATDQSGESLRHANLVSHDELPPVRARPAAGSRAGSSATRCSRSSSSG